MMFKFTMSHPGFAEVLKSAGVHAAVEHATESVAANVADQGLTAGGPAEESGTAIIGAVEMTTTDRAHGSVTIKHPAGLAMQAKRGVLTKAAAAAGLEVRAK